MLMRSILLATATAVAAAPWEKIGPYNIGDAVSGQGYAGTLADAVSPRSNPDLIYTGGHNNGAASGVLKSTNRGKMWIPMCNGLWDTTIGSLIMLDEAGDHVLAGTPTGIYETKDGASSWKLMPGSAGIGWARSMKNGTIDGEPRVLAGVDNGLASWDPAKPDGEWVVSQIPDPMWTKGVRLTRYITVADVLPSSVVGVCLGGFAFVVTVTGPTSADWKNTSMQCLQVAINPNNKEHFIYSNISSEGKQTWESLDGGKTSHDLNSHFPWHVHIDRRGWMYHAAEHSADFSTDGGKTWQSYQYTTTQRLTNATGSRIPMDYQRIVSDFAGGIAFVSDQGLFIKPEGDSIELIGASGNMSTNIAISPAISLGDGKSRWIVTTAWDWGPLASWDGGAHWPGWNCPDCEGPGFTHGGIGEGGFTRAFGKSNHVLMIHHNNVLHSSRGGKNFTLVSAPFSMPWPIFPVKPGSRSEPDGRIFIITTTPPPNATEYIVINRHFGAGQFNNTPEGWQWGATIPPRLAGCGLTTSPVDGGAKLYAVASASTCIATSTDEGATWSDCWTGLEGQPIGSLVIKDESTMFVMRAKMTPLRSRDGGKSWSPLDSLEPLAAVGFAFDLSWTGQTIIVHGLDTTAIAQGRKAPFVWRSTDDGDTWTDETDDVITNHPAQGSWFEGKYYLTSSGQGIMAKTFE